jgi:hypothetical protein
LSVESWGLVKVNKWVVYLVELLAQIMVENLVCSKVLMMVQSTAEKLERKLVAIWEAQRVG